MSSVWGQMLTNYSEIMLEDKECKQAKLFRRRFRMPYRVFHKVFVPQCKEVFGESYRFSIPIEIKALIVLRILGRDACADDCYELSLVSETSCNRIFLFFLKQYPRLYLDKWVNFPPLGSKDLKNIMETYRYLSFTGCVGSLDATHVKWEKCPKEFKWRCHGKEGEPTVAFQCVCSHTRRVLYMSKAHCGAENDKTTIRKPMYPIRLFLLDFAESLRTARIDDY